VLFAPKSPVSEKLVEQITRQPHIVLKTAQPPARHETMGLGLLLSANADPGQRGPHTMPRAWISPRLMAQDRQIGCVDIVAGQILRLAKLLVGKAARRSRTSWLWREAG
jgi:hypothetical protein